MDYGKEALYATLAWIGRGQNPADVQARRQAIADHHRFAEVQRKERAKVNRDARRAQEKMAGDRLKAQIKI